jgi:fatty-acyl-CoA synthase
MKIFLYFKVLLNFLLKYQKGTTLTHHAILNNSYVLSKFVGEASGQSIYYALVRQRFSVVFPSYRYDVKEILDSIQKYRCTAVNGLSKILLNVLNYPKIKEYDLSSMYSVLSGGQMIPAEIILRFKTEHKVKYFFCGYGITENVLTHCQLYALENFEPHMHEASLGQPLPYYEFKVVKPETNEILPLKTEGVLHVRGLSVTKSY